MIAVLTNAEWLHDGAERYSGLPMATAARSAKGLQR
jgi:hypothetical protein